MTIYADYPFYRGQYFGKKLTEEEFQSFIISASALIDEMTNGRAAAHSDMDEIRYAACAVCEQMDLNDKHAGIASETVGKVSRTYITQKSRQLVPAALHGRRESLPDKHRTVDNGGAFLRCGMTRSPFIIKPVSGSTAARCCPDANGRERQRSHPRNGGSSSITL